MKAVRGLSLLAALLVLGGAVGCPGEPVEPCFGTSEPQQTGPRVFGVGEAVSFNVLASMPVSCESGTVPRWPESVTVEVYDPENQPVSATATLTSGGSMATVRFTPTMRGRHHVLVAFAPVGSLHQLGVFVVEDRRGEAPMATLPTGTTCPYLDRTTQGTWLCGAWAVREPGMPLQRLATAFSASTVVAGDVVWVMDENRVSRYRDSGSGPLELTGSAPLPAAPPGGAPPPTVDSRVATPEELVLLHGEVIARYTFTDVGGVSNALSTRWVRPQAGTLPLGLDAAAALLVRAGARLLLVSRVNDQTTFQPRLQACPYQLGTQGAYVSVSNESCQTLEGELVGYEDGVLWTRSSDGTLGPVKEVLRRYTAASGRLLEQGVLSLDGNLSVTLPMLRPGPVHPTLAAVGAAKPYAAARWNPASATVALELMPEAPSSGPPHVGERFIWVESPGGGVRVHPRASTR
jgi:hypothetical protein